MSIRYCATCMSKLTQHETAKCRRCKCAVERAKWLKQCAQEMNEFKMETTGSTILDRTIKESVK